MTADSRPAMPATPHASRTRTLTVGVEEEFLLVDPDTGAPEGRADAILARQPSNAVTALLQRELLTCQVESATGVCTTLDQLHGQLQQAREALSSAAIAEHLRLLASGTPPFAGRPCPVSGGERFMLIAERYRGVVADHQVCGTRVHVGVPDRDTAVAVLNHVRGWLPTLLAISANSPLYLGADTGYASWRMVQQSRFPGLGLPPYFGSTAEYETQIARLVDCGVLVDGAMSFWLARISPTVSTIELRVADTATTAEEAVLQAALGRALIATALHELAAGHEAPHRNDDQLERAAVWSAARYGLDGPGIDLATRQPVSATELVWQLVRWVTPALEDAGDLAFVRESVALLAEAGTGARRQRGAATRGAKALLDTVLVEPRESNRTREEATACLSR